MSNSLRDQWNYVSLLSLREKHELEMVGSQMGHI